MVRMSMHLAEKILQKMMRLAIGLSRKGAEPLYRRRAGQIKGVGVQP
ncbi:MAG: hypothetical protein KatS3mg048_2316 [Caldilinea sp.]|jgi:hypothetical protein|nr:MAG: hypothetical protein KatS3mg048_2316 [Caldilinea sp.]